MEKTPSDSLPLVNSPERVRELVSKKECLNCGKPAIPEKQAKRGICARCYEFFKRQIRNNIPGVTWDTLENVGLVAPRAKPGRTAGLGDGHLETILRKRAESRASETLDDMKAKVTRRKKKGSQ